MKKIKPKICFSLCLCASVPALLISLAGCSKGSSLEFLTPEETSTTQGGSDSAVNEQLARDAGVLHLIYHVGPVDLAANSKLETMINHPLTMKFQVDQPLWVIGFEPKVVAATGETLPSTLLHQAIISNMHEENPVCAEGTGGNPFVVATSALTKVNLPEGFGYAVLPEDPLEAKVVLYNPTEENYVDVSFELDVIAKPMNEFTGMKDVKPLFLDIEPCTHKSISVEPEKFVKRQATFTIPNSGNIVVAHGIVQDFAAFVELTKGNDVMPFWKADAVLDANHHVSELTNNPLEDPAGIKIKKGGAVTIGVAYDNTQTNWLEGASAAVMVYYAMDEE